MKRCPSTGKFSIESTIIDSAIFLVSISFDVVSRPMRDPFSGLWSEIENRPNFHRETASKTHPTSITSPPLVSNVTIIHRNFRFLANDRAAHELFFFSLPTRTPPLDCTGGHNTSNSTSNCEIKNANLIPSHRIRILAPKSVSIRACAIAMTNQTIRREVDPTFECDRLLSMNIQSFDFIGDW